MRISHRLLPGIGALVLAVLATGARAQESPMLINAGVGGGWYEPATSGQGFALDVAPESNQLVAYWFTYPETGGGREWFIAQGDISGAAAELVVYRTSNGVFDQPSAVGLEAVGAARVVFDSCSAARLAYQLDETGVQGAIDLQRLGTTRYCEQFLAGADLDAVSHDNSWFNLGGDWLFEGCVPLDGGASHGKEWLSFTDTVMSLVIENFTTPDCTGSVSLQAIEMQLQRVDKVLADLDGELVIANRYLLTDPQSGQSIKQLWYVDDRGEIPLLTHGVLDSPVDEDGFPTQLHSLFFAPSPGGD